MSVVGFLAVAAASHGLGQAGIGVTETFKNNQPWEVPGKILKPGTYQIRVDDSLSDRSILQILSGDQKKVITTFIAVPSRALRREEGTSFAFWDKQKSTFVVRGWIPTGADVAREFVYEKAVAARIATKENQVVLAVDPASEPNLSGKKLEPADMRAIQLWSLSLGSASPKGKPSIEAAKYNSETAGAGTPSDTPAAPGRVRRGADAASSSKAPQVLAQVQGNTSPLKSAPDQTSPQRLPTTASLTPTLLLLGIFSLTIAFALRRLRIGGGGHA